MVIDRFDISIVGAGIVGLATAWELLQRDRSLEICVVEKEDAPARHQTGHNSGVIHSGLYYTPGSRKAQQCRAGRRALLEFCDEFSISYRLSGKLVIASRDDQLGRLDDLEARGNANELSDLERLGPEGIREHEPDAVGVAALWVPEAGVIDYGAVARTLVYELQLRGVEFHFASPATSIRETPDGITVRVRTGTVNATRLVNCGGLQADRIARRCGVRSGIRILPVRGEFFALAPAVAPRVRGLIYPVPDPRFPYLGVHLTRGIDGSVKAGPNAVLAFAREGYRFSTVNVRDMLETACFSGSWRLLRRTWTETVRELQRSLSMERFASACAELVPGISTGHLSRSPAGVRAQALHGSGRLLDDFAIFRTQKTLHILNAPSPAATACFAIGREIAATVLSRKP